MNAFLAGPARACRSLTVIAGLLVASRASAEIEIASPTLRDGAVLQRGQPIVVSGRARGGARVTATLAKETKSATATQAGRFRIVFDARPAGGPLTLSLTADQDTKTVRDLLVGDVWVCSGQSNMEFTLSRALEAEAEIQAAHAPQIRHFKIPRSWAVTPSDTLDGGSWARATPDNVGDFTAVGYYFAKQVHAELGVPIGLVGTNWGGSAIEAWMSARALGKAPQQTAQVLQKLVQQAEADARVVKKKLRRWPGSLVDTVDKADGDYSGAKQDTGEWATIDVPGLWEGNGFAGVDGVMWFRTTFPLTQAEARGDLVLGLARIDDSDTTWVNGREVGSTRGYDQVRRYVVPAGLLHAGDNSLAVRVEDTGVGGGIYSDEALLFVQPAGGAPRSLKGQWRVRPDKVRVQPTGEMNQVETALYNKMIHPLLETPVRGVLWYQGESNAGSAAQAIRYAGQFRSLIWTWRAAWKQPEMPFYWVQLPNFESGWGTDEAIPWALLRESQAGALALPHTGQAVTLDVGDAHDIHPRDKKTVGERLALVALHETYGKKNVHFRGPVLAATRIEPTRVVARFTTTSGLSTRKPGARVVGLELGGAGGKFEAAQGVVAGDDVLIPYRGKAPTMLRYAWDDNPQAANLQDRDGMPAEPFRARLE